MCVDVHVRVGVHERVRTRVKSHIRWSCHDGRLGNMHRPCTVCCWQGDFTEVQEQATLNLQDLSVTFEVCSSGQWAGMLDSLRSAFPVRLPAQHAWNAQMSAQC